MAIAGEMNDSPRSRLLRGLVLCLIFAAALGIRLYHVGDPPLEFATPRQYRTALVARAYLYAEPTNAPAWQQSVAAVNGRRSLGVEVPVLEWFAGSVYRLMGREDFRVGRLLSILFWLGGGVAVFALAGRISSATGSLLSVGLYLLLPFGILASRSYQHDPLMVVLSIVTVWLSVRFHERPGWWRLLAACVPSVLAMSVKPTAAFFVLIPFFVMTVVRRKTAVFRDLHAAVFLVLSVAPVALFVVLSPKQTAIQGHIDLWFQPHLFLQPEFWRDWWSRVLEAVGLWPLVCALLGLPLVARGVSGGAVFGLWFGYLVYGLVFNFTIHSHNYYSLVLVPIVALSAGPALAAMIDAGRRSGSRLARPVAVFALVLGALQMMYQVRTRIVQFDGEGMVSRATRVGEAVEHSEETVILSEPRFTPQPYLYHGEFCAREWPSMFGHTIQERYRNETDLTLMPAAKRFERYGEPDFFVVLDPGELERQPDLKQLLEEVASAPADIDGVLVYDLRASR